MSGCDTYTLSLASAPLGKTMPMLKVKLPRSLGKSVYMCILFGCNGNIIVAQKPRKAKKYVSEQHGIWYEPTGELGVLFRASVTPLIEEGVRESEVLAKACISTSAGSYTGQCCGMRGASLK